MGEKRKDSGTEGGPLSNVSVPSGCVGAWKFFSTSHLHKLRRVEPQSDGAVWGLNVKLRVVWRFPTKSPTGGFWAGVAFSPVETFSRGQQMTSGIYLTRNPTSWNGICVDP